MRFGYRIKTGMTVWRIFTEPSIFIVRCPIKTKRKVLGAIAGANLFWAEVGANPRDVEDKTEEGRGESVSSCRTIYQESNWDILSGPSRYYN
jgi:hypothetical protein